jgi:hypothetical protein
MEEFAQHYGQGAAGNASTTPCAMFKDGESLKDDMYDKFDDLDYDVRNFYWPNKESLAARIATNNWFGSLTLFVIIFNILWLGYDGDANDEPNIWNAEARFLGMELFFCAFFTFEIAVRVIAFKIKKHIVKDKWTVFDVCLVLFMHFEMFVLPSIVRSLGANVDLSLLGLLRMFRVARVFRIARLIRSIPELVVLIKGMYAASRAVLSTGFLLLMLIYTTSLVFRLAVGNEDASAGARRLKGGGGGGGGDMDWLKLDTLGSTMSAEFKLSKMERSDNICFEKGCVLARRFLMIERAKEQGTDLIIVKYILLNSLVRDS